MDMRWKPNAVVEVTVTPACPRCGSSNTKFCYYNNYSLTQPRYFCKGCRRYWTKGGSLRNVPVGGGCRKRRRGKSLCGSSSTGSVSSSRSYSGHGAMLESSSSYPGHGHVSTSIDLAAVYANFLNQKPQWEAPRVEVPELLYGGIPPFDYDATGLGQESEFAILSDKSSEIRLGDENTRYFRGINSFDPKHHYTNDDRLITNMNSLMMMNNSSLPPLPGEDVSPSEGMAGSSFDLMLPDHIFQSTNQIEQDSQQLNVGDGNPLISMLNLEAIFRP